MVNDFSATVIVGVDFTNSSRLSSGLTAFGLSGVVRWSGFAVSVVMSALPIIHHIHSVVAQHLAQMVVEGLHALCGRVEKHGLKVATVYALPVAHQWSVCHDWLQVGVAS